MLLLKKIIFITNLMITLIIIGLLVQRISLDVNAVFVLRVQTVSELLIRVDFILFFGIQFELKVMITGAFKPHTIIKGKLLNHFSPL